MAETNSESNPLLSSEETDDSMNDADAVTEVSSQAVNPSASEFLLELSDAITFPADSFLHLMEGVNKLPTWTVYPKQLCACIKATAAIVRSRQRHSTQEESMMRKLVREGLSQSFTKCLEDHAVLNWPQGTQQDILLSCIALVDLAVAKLENMVDANLAEEVAELEEDLNCILAELSSALDPHTPFHIKNLDAELPGKLQILDQLFAEPTAESDTVAIPRGRGSESPDAVRLRQHEWLAYLVNEFGRLDGFELVCKVLETPGKHTILFLDNLLAPFVKAEEVLVPDALVTLADRLQLLVAFISEALKDDVERLSDKGKDRMFTSASSLLEKINVLLQKCFGPAEADAVVGKVQKQFIVKLLGQSSFSKHMSAVRETNNLLMRALDLRNTDDGNSIKVNVEWMHQNDVVKHLLRANLHQKQYVDQVQKVLKNLTIEGGLQEDHLDFLWNLTEKVDTFEAVKNNVYDMLGDLAQDFNNEQLDTLFSKFEACTGKPLPDAMKIMDLMRRLAKSDTKGVMAKRVMNLLWSMMMNPEAPSEVSKSPAITDALQAYANRKGLVNNEITYEYMRQCISAIQAGTGVLAAMSLLHRLIQTSVREANWQDGMESLRALNKDYGIVDVVIASLESFMAKERHALLAVSHQVPCAYNNHQHEEAVREYANFLLSVPSSGSLQLTWKHVEQLWHIWIDNPVFNSDRYLGLQWLMLLLQQQRTGAIGQEIMRPLLTEKLTTVDISLLMPHEVVPFWNLFIWTFRWMAATTNKMTVAPVTPEEPPSMPVVRSLDLTGLPAMWRFVLDVECHMGIVTESQLTLVSLYTNLDGELQKQTGTVRSQFIRTCLGELLPAAALLTGKVPGQGSWKEHAGPVPLMTMTRELLMAGKRAARCLSLLQDFVEKCQGRTMPAVPMHAASFQGSVARFEVQTQSSKQQPNRFRITCHSNMYIGQIRRLIASKLQAQAEHVRLFAHGHELLFDARLVRGEHITDGSTIMAASSPNANNYTVLTPEKAAEMEAASPASLLAKSPELYDVLLCLADLCPDYMVRQNVMKLLDVIPTDEQIVRQLRAVLSSVNACDSMRQLLIGSGVVKPARLLYTLQALNALLFPVTAGEDAAAAANPQLMFVNSGCISALLEAVKAANNAHANDMHTVRSLHSTAQLLLTRLQGTIAKAATSDVSMADALSADQPMSAQEAAPQSSDTSVTSAEPTAVASTPTAAVTVTLERGDLSPTQKAGIAEKAVLSEMLLFYLNLAMRAGRAWGNDSLDKLGQDIILPDLDAQINHDALLALKNLLEMQPHLHDVLFNSPQHKQAMRVMMLEGLLNCGHEFVRGNTFKIGERLAKSANGQGHLHLLEMLHNLDFADSYPHHCTEYYRLLREILRTIPASPPQINAVEIPVAEAMLSGLVAVSGSLTAVDEDDARLEGKLGLLLELVTVLDRRHIGTASGGGLVHRIIADYLFPESCFLHKLAEAKQSLLRVPISDVAQALKARCLTKTSRQAALDLLHDLMLHNPTNLRDGMELIREIHLSTDIIREDVLDYSPKQQARKGTSFVGLKNGGATCYMNSVFQQIFMQPSIRRLILSSKEAPKAERQDSVFYQLQSIFANLALSNKDFHRPGGFWKAFKDYDGAQLSLREHQDAYEFFTRLQDLVDQQMRDNKEKPVMQLVMGGKFAQQIICRSVAYRSEKEEDFYQVSLDVRGKRTLEESLDFYVQGELMEGDNQYLCEELGKKVDAVKRNCIKVLPHMLVIHLKRFEYDYETMNRWKIKDRFEFPQELDMYKYTVTGLEEREAAEAAISGDGSEGAPPASAPANLEQYQYFLKGIVVHSGTAFAGHYYSYIRVRAEAGQQPANTGRWFCFDDTSVDPWDVAQLDRDCFGGKYTIDLQDPHLPTGPKEYDRPNSAYMLFYERADGLEPVTMMDEITAAAPREAASQASGVPVADVTADMSTTSTAEEDMVLMSQERWPGAVSNAEASSSGRELATVPIPAIADSIPSIYEDILCQNLKLMQELRLLDRDYFKFLFRLVKDISEQPFLPPSSMRRTEPSPSQSGGNSAGSHPGSPEPMSGTPPLARREADSEQAAERVMNFACQFLLRVFLRSSSLLREDQAGWGQVMLTIMEASVAANRWFLYLCFADSKGLSAQTWGADLRLDDEMLDNYLVWCDYEDITKFVSQVLLQALKLAIARDNGAVSRRLLNPVQQLEPRSGAWAVHQVVLKLRSVFQQHNILSNKHFPMQFCCILREYASLGHQQREHLNAMGFLKEVIAVIDSFDGRDKLDEVFVLMELTSLLTRSCDFGHLPKLAPGRRNKYALPDPYPQRGRADVFELLCQSSILDIGWPFHLTNEHIRRLLQFLQWQNRDTTLEWLGRIPNTVRKLQGEPLLELADALVAVIAIEDDWLVDRVKCALMDPQPPGRELGILHQVSDAPTVSGRELTKRFALIKLALFLVHRVPEAFVALQDKPQWVTIAGELVNMRHMALPICERADFEEAEEIADRLAGEGSPALEVEEDEEEEEEEELVEEEAGEEADD